MKPILNKEGMTLFELIAYTALIGTVIILLGGLLRQMSQSYDEVNGRGAIVNEANDMMRIILTASNQFQPDYIVYCRDEFNEIDEQCIELTRITELQITESGLIEYKKEIITKRIIIKNGDLYYDGLKINKEGFKINDNKSSFVITECKTVTGGGCEEAIIEMNLALYWEDSDPNKAIEFKSQIATY